jgi:hypothetical protein
MPVAYAEALASTYKKEPKLRRKPNATKGETPKNK